MFDKKFITLPFFIRYIKSFGLYKKLLYWYENHSNSYNIKELERFSNDILPCNLYRWFIDELILDERSSSKLITYCKKFHKLEIKRSNDFKYRYILIKNLREYEKISKYFENNGFYNTINLNKYKLQSYSFFHYHLFKIGPETTITPQLKYYDSSFSIKDLICRATGKNPIVMTSDEFIDFYEDYKKRMWFNELSLINKIKYIYNKIKSKRN